MSGPARYARNVKVSERHGAGEWTLEKIALALLMPLGVWVAVSAVTLIGADHVTVLAWFADRLNAGLAVATLIVFALFGALAWKVIVEDYIHRPANKAILLGLVNLAFILLVLAGVFFIARLALGSAALPAGLEV